MGNKTKQINKTTNRKGYQAKDLNFFKVTKQRNERTTSLLLLLLRRKQ